MADEELNENVHQLAARNYFELVDQLENSKLLSQIEQFFLRGAPTAWSWEQLRENPAVFDYGNGDPFRLLESAIGSKTEIYLFVTDDNPPPWTAVRGRLDRVVEALGELPFFEYFLVPATLNTQKQWIVFDNHHNQLLAVGDISFRKSSNGVNSGSS